MKIVMKDGAIREVHDISNVLWNGKFFKCGRNVRTFSEKRVWNWKRPWAHRSISEQHVTYTTEVLINADEVREVIINEKEKIDEVTKKE